VGGGLGLGPNGLHILQRLAENLVRDIVRSGYVISHSNMKDKNGQLLVRMDIPRLTLHLHRSINPRISLAAVVTRSGGVCAPAFQTAMLSAGVLRG
jgi:hypothetical protein